MTDEEFQNMLKAAYVKITLTTDRDLYCVEFVMPKNKNAWHVVNESRLQKATLDYLDRWVKKVQSLRRKLEARNTRRVEEMTSDELTQTRAGARCGQAGGGKPRASLQAEAQGEGQMTDEEFQ
jgi:hypothetical protein